jgi:hypothetical protein
MVQQSERPVLALAGTRKEQALAEKIFERMLARGMFMSANSVIKVTVTSLASLLEAEGEKVDRESIVAALAANASVFTLENIDDEEFVSTTKGGRAPVLARSVAKHTFSSRFITPLPRPERPTVPRHRPLPAAPIVDVLAEIDLAAPELEVEPETTLPAIPEVEREVEAPAIVARTITTQIVKPTDVTDVDDINLAAALRDRLGADPRVANFGEQWLMEDRVPRFSRGDLRRLREYMQEKEQPLTDEDLAQDVLGVRPGSPDFELTRFALNYRLSNEHREFEFVGTGNQRFWSTSGLPQIGTTRRKLNEIGTDFRYLLEQETAAPAYRSRDSIGHTLSFYEYVHGLLPYDLDMQELLPAPMTASQKSAVLTFECPQSFTTYLVELRYPTPNRGGFILGLDDFYTENLVPGAIIAIQRTDNDGHYKVEYLPETVRSDQLLELDERRAQRYVFRPTTFACGVEESQLLTEARFGGLANEKPLDEKVRRRPEAVVAATFERIGEDRDGNFSSDFETLLGGVNVERPMSVAVLRAILDHDDSGAFSRDPEAADSYTYVPGTSP